MHKCSVSVIIPARNEQKLIGSTLERFYVRPATSTGMKWKSSS